jgi:SsrA-binding protein
MRKIFNKRVGREYNILDTFEAGISLIGSEVKSIKEGRVKLDGAYVKFISGMPMLVNCDVPLYQFATIENYDSNRSRRLLLHKKEIIRLITKLSSSSRLTVIPLSIYEKSGKIKLEIGLVSGKKTWEIKRVEKNRDENRRIDKEIKEWVKK